MSGRMNKRRKKNRRISLVTNRIVSNCRLSKRDTMDAFPRMQSHN